MSQDANTRKVWPETIRPVEQAKPAAPMADDAFRRRGFGTRDFDRLFDQPVSEKEEVKRKGR
ncbi:hypothetical protein [Rhizobium leguminosarum]